MMTRARSACSITVSTYGLPGPTASEPVNAIRNHQKFAAYGRFRPALNQIPDREIRAGHCAQVPHREPESLGCCCVLRGQVLRNVHSAVAHVTNAYSGRRRLRQDELAKIFKLRAECG